MSDDIGTHDLPPSFYQLFWIFFKYFCSRCARRLKIIDQLVYSAAYQFWKKSYRKNSKIINKNMEVDHGCQYHQTQFTIVISMAKLVFFSLKMTCFVRFSLDIHISTYYKCYKKKLYFVCIWKMDPNWNDIRPYSPSASYTLWGWTTQYSDYPLDGGIFTMILQLL